MGRNLWTPDRDIPIDNKVSNEEMRPDQMMVVEKMHAIAQKHGIELRCSRCGKPFQGFNGGHARTTAIVCGCREIKAETGARLVAASSFQG